MIKKEKAKLKGDLAIKTQTSLILNQPATILSFLQGNVPLKQKAKYRGKSLGVSSTSEAERSGIAD